MNMTPLAWAAVAFGALVAVTIQLVLIYDPYAVARHLPTISRLSLLAAIRHPWFAYTIAAVFGGVVGALLGHLIYARDGQGQPDAVIAAEVSLFVCFLLGHRYLGQ